MGMGLGDNETVNFKLGAVQVDRIFLGSAYVWPNIPISNVVATDNLVGLVTVTWSDTNEIHPNTYDLYADDVKIASNVSSPYDYTIDESTKMYSIRGLYGGGHHIGSNEDSGTSLSGIVPGPITDFEASDNQYYQVQCWWSDASGDPIPTYDLYEDGGIVAQGVASGHVMASAVGTRPWKVVATNAEGDTDSNIDNGTSLAEPLPEPPGFVDYCTAGTFTFDVPYGWDSFQVCFIGGGGSGACDDNNQRIGGGFAGSYFSATYPASGSVTVVVGAGGAAVGTNNDGLPGESSYWNGLEAGGGAGGTIVGDYQGNGAQVERCGIYTFDGGANNYSGDTAFGGQAGMGSGGDGGIYTGGNGSGGAGGGAGYGSDETVRSGSGGDGCVRISWGL